MANEECCICREEGTPWGGPVPFLGGNCCQDCFQGQVFRALSEAGKDIVTLAKHVISAQHQERCWCTEQDECAQCTAVRVLKRQGFCVQWK